MGLEWVARLERNSLPTAGRTFHQDTAGQPATMKPAQALRSKSQNPDHTPAAENAMV
jgi:hypothetical protein